MAARRVSEEKSIHDPRLPSGFQGLIHHPGQTAFRHPLFTFHF